MIHNDVDHMLSITAVQLEFACILPDEVTLTVQLCRVSEIEERLTVVDACLAQPAGTIMFLDSLKPLPDYERHLPRCASFLGLFTRSLTRAETPAILMLLPCGHSDVYVFASLLAQADDSAAGALHRHPKMH